MAELKTAEQRKVDLATLLQRVESMPIPEAKDIPAEIADFCKLMSGADIREILNEKKAESFHFNGVCKVITTKKKRTMYEVFSTGDYALVPLLGVGKRMLKCKITLMIE